MVGCPSPGRARGFVAPPPAPCSHPSGSILRTSVGPDLDPVVAPVGDIDTRTAVHGDSVRQPEGAIPRTFLAEPADELRMDLTGRERVVDRDSLRRHVGDVDQAGVVDGCPTWQPE